MNTPTLKKPTAGQYLFSGLIDFSLLASFYVWQIHGSDGAGNLYIFMAWIMVLLGLLVGVTCCYSPQYLTPKITWPFAWKWFERARTAFMVMSAAWLGQYALAGFMLAAVLLIAAARARLAESKVAP